MTRKKGFHMLQNEPTLPPDEETAPAPGGAPCPALMGHEPRRPVVSFDARGRMVRPIEVVS